MKAQAKPLDTSPPGQVLEDENTVPDASLSNVATPLSLQDDTTVLDSSPPFIPSGTLLRERPDDAEAMKRVFAVLEKQLSHSDVAGTLEEEEFFTRAAHTVGAIGSTLILLEFLDEWIGRERRDAVFDEEGLAAFLGWLATPLHTPVIPTLAPVATTAKALGSTLAGTSESALDNLSARIGDRSTLTQALFDQHDEAFLEWLESAQALATALTELEAKHKRRPTEEKQLVAILRLFSDCLPSLIETAAIQVAFEVTDTTPADPPREGRILRLGSNTTLANVAKDLSELPSFAPYPRLQLQAALQAYNGLNAQAKLPAGYVLYIPTVPQLTQAMHAWPDIMPLPPTSRHVVRRRLVALIPFFSQHASLDMHTGLLPLLQLLDRMPTAPSRYDVPESSVQNELQGKSDELVHANGQGRLQSIRHKLDLLLVDVVHANEQGADAKQVARQLTTQVEELRHEALELLQTTANQVRATLRVKRGRGTVGPTSIRERWQSALESIAQSVSRLRASKDSNTANAAALQIQQVAAVLSYSHPTGVLTK